MGLQSGHGLGGAIVACDDLLQGMQQQVLPFRVPLNLGEDKWQVHLKVAGTHTTYTQSLHVTWQSCGVT